ncbi:MAG: gliding motility lipoprotein GldH [Paludibacteraceae bacterium]|nr:gliding motility lipoprotein GldH [Paludibacteraceae bacterium]
MNKIILGFLLLLLTSCGAECVYQDVKDIPSDGWKKDEPLEFQYSMTDTTDCYEIVVDVRNEGSYKYQNLWLFIEATSPFGDVYSDTIECALADNYGHWVGDGIASYYANIYHLPVSFMPMVKFPKQGEYKIKIWQGMREDVLEGISDVGIRVRRVELPE